MLTRALFFTFLVLGCNVIGTTTLFGWLDDELQEAVRDGDAYRFTTLLQRNATPDAPRSRGMILSGFSPLMTAVVSTPIHKLLGFVHALVKAGANPSLKNIKKDRALDYAKARLWVIENSCWEKLFPCRQRRRIEELKEVIAYLEEVTEKTDEKKPEYKSSSKDELSAPHTPLLNKKQINNTPEPGQGCEK